MKNKMSSLTDLFEGHGEIILREGDKIVKRIPIKKNTITYAFGYWWCMGLYERAQSVIEADDHMKSRKCKVGSDTITASTRAMPDLVTPFDPVIEETITDPNVTFAGTVIEDGGEGTPLRLHVLFSVTFPGGSFSGAQTVGEIGLDFMHGSHSPRGIIPGITGSGNDFSAWSMVARISVADGDFAPVTPTAVQALTATYQIDL